MSGHKLGCCVLVREQPCRALVATRALAGAKLLMHGGADDRVQEAQAAPAVEDLAGAEHVGRLRGSALVEPREVARVPQQSTVAEDRRRARELADGRRVAGQPRSKRRDHPVRRGVQHVVRPRCVCFPERHGQLAQEERVAAGDLATGPAQRLLSVGQRARGRAVSCRRRSEAQAAAPRRRRPSPAAPRRRGRRAARAVGRRPRAGWEARPAAGPRRPGSAVTPRRPNGRRRRGGRAVASRRGSRSAGRGRGRWSPKPRDRRAAPAGRRASRRAAARRSPPRRRRRRTRRRCLRRGRQAREAGGPRRTRRRSRALLRAR